MARTTNWSLPVKIFARNVRIFKFPIRAVCSAHFMLQGLIFIAGTSLICKVVPFDAWLSEERMLCKREGVTRKN